MPRKVRDWDAVVEKLREQPERWILAFSDVPRSAAIHVRQGKIRKIKELGGLVEARTTNRYTNEDGLERADIWIRWTREGYAIKPEHPVPALNPKRRKQTYTGHTTSVPYELYDRLRTVTKAADATMLGYVTSIVEDIADNGSDFRVDPRPSQTINFQLSPERWQRLNKVAEEGGGSLRQLIIYELSKRLGISAVRGANNNGE